MKARSRRPATAPLALLLAAVAMAGCGKQAAIGEANSLVILTSSDSLWNRMEDTTRAALEHTVFTVRQEKKFFVEQADTSSPHAGQYKLFRQVLVFGTPDDPVVRHIAEEAGVDVPPGAPSIVQAQDVWAHDQVATAVVLEPGREAESWAAQLPQLTALVDSQYRTYVHQRMYVSGEDTATERQLASQYGFRLRFPMVYQVDTARDSVVVVRNDNPDPSELIRSVLVAFRPRVDSLTGAMAYAWRRAVDTLYYHNQQAIDTVPGTVTTTVVNGHPALEATGIWKDVETSYPAGGPFIARLVQCPDRTYLVDGWLYAPGKSKYQYMIQIRDIMDSFDCGASG
ncbi:MAG TPA: DUF4837 family protein [Gemmatimonadota bacterium]|nr:DUF4837 family protein [Gemmatimonadota bacterium]